MANFDKKSRKPVELSSIINVVQRSPKPSGKSSYHKMELKSVVHVKSDGSKTKARNPQDHKSTKSSKLESEKPMLLLPFGHQVSGRASMLCYDETTILKPYVSRELYFYQSMPEKLKQFTPQFRGLVTVSFVEDSSTTTMLAYALPCTLVKPNVKSILKLFTEEPKPHSKRCVKDFGKTHVIYPDQSIDKIVLCDDGDTDRSLFVEPVNFDPIISADQDDDVVSDLSQGFDTSVCIDESAESSKENRSQQKFSTTGLKNPWNAKVLGDAWLKLKVNDGEDATSGKKKRFTLLENVVAHYRRPCVLDLKIGTRIRENASDDKVARHVTAINIGARLSGMQIYHPDKEQFSYHNKYYGHNLSVAGFKANLRHFFSRGMYPVSTKKEFGPNGKLINRDLIKGAIGKLRKLKDIIGSMQSHRFYSSSLLLLYEGDVSAQVFKSDISSSAVRSDAKGISPRSFSFSEYSQTSRHDLDTPNRDNRKHRISRNCQQSSDSAKSEKSHKKTGQSSQFKSSKHDSVSSSYQNDICGERDQTEALCPRKSRRQVPHDNDISSHHKPVSSCHTAKVKQLNHCCATSHESSRSHSAKIHSSTSDHVHNDNGRSSDHSSSKIHEPPPHIPYSWKSWPTRSKRMKMNNFGSQNNEPNDFTRNSRHGFHSDCDNSLSNHDVIDVRMIDFAHYCFRDGTMHPGPDKGFIFGLENLIILLEDMLKL